MTASALEMTPLTPDSLATLVRRLPAQQQADLRWAPKKLEHIIAPLLGPDPTGALAAAAGALWTEILVPMMSVIDVLSAASQEELARDIAEKTRAELERIESLPLSAEAKRAARRSSATFFMLGALAIDALHQQGPLASGIGPPEGRQLELKLLLESEHATPFSEGRVPMFRAMMLVSALLHGGKISAPTHQLETLAELADVAAFQGASQLLHQQPPIRTGWYFDGPGAQQYAAFALWSETPAVRSKRLQMVMRSWGEDDDRDPPNWLKLREGLEANRLSSRPLFG